MTRLDFRYSIVVIAIILTSFFNTLALDADFFASESKLANGKWVKIRVEENGIYELSYDELREMGFANPEKVGIYGRGGRQLSEKFANHIDNLPPVGILHKNDKIYFYGQGAVNIRYRSEFKNPVNRRFLRESINTYSEYGYYFITDSRDDVCHIQTASGNIDETKPDYTLCYDYFYHEVDSINFCLSGRLFLGESFVNADSRTKSFKYSIPGAIPGSASLECRFYATNPAGSKLYYGLNADDMIEADVYAPEQNYYAGTIYPANSEINLASADGHVVIKYSPNGNVTNANLDYILIGAKKTIGFHNGEAQFRAFVPDYSTDNYGLISIANSSEDVLIWDIDDCNNVTNLPFSFSDGMAKAKYLTESKKIGLMMVFDTSKEQHKITWHQEIDNQNLHSISADDVPELLIISPTYLCEKAEKLAEFHRQYDDMDVMVIDSQKIINEFSDGTPDAMAYRLFCKMLYDRNPEKFKNLLLFGEMHYDNRQLLRQSPTELLISYQTEESINSLMTFCISDFYGMLEDTPNSKGIQYDIVNIGVGELPCRSLADADLIIDKTARYITDKSYAYWLANMQVIGDGPDNNEHLTQSENIASEMRQLSDDEIQVSKIYVSAYPEEQIQTKLLQNLNDGLIYGTYLGHASIESLSSNRSVWTTKDARKLNNERLSFISFGACTVTSADGGARGSAEAMMFSSPYGIVGGLMSTRTAYSHWNYVMLSSFQQALLQEQSSSNNTINPALPRISSRRTIGEVYAKAKTNIQVPHCNEFVYHLICDPAIIIPVATCEIHADIDSHNDDLTQIRPGSKINLSGSITDREGNQFSDYNGTLVARIYNPATTIPTNGYENSVSVKINYDESVAATYAIDVINGKFSSEIIVPSNINTLNGNTSKIRMSAYDADQRIGASGIIDISIADYDQSVAIADNEAPSIESFYINSSDFCEGDAVGSDFILYASLTDDSGILTSNSDLVSNTYIQLDGRKTFFDISQYMTVADGCKKSNIAYPMNDIACGRHVLTLHTTDIMGNTTKRSIGFYVADSQIAGEIKVDASPVIESADISVSHTATEQNIQKQFIIVNAYGQIVRQVQTLDDTITWDVKDDNGQRVSPGLYKVFARLNIGNSITGTTPTTQIIVINNLK